MSMLFGTSAGRIASACFHTGPDLSRVGAEWAVFHTVISHAGGWAPQAKSKLLYVVKKLGL